MGTVVNVYKPSYMGGRGKRFTAQGKPWQS
jgi:hypothetical protein